MARRSLLCQFMDATADTFRDPVGAFDKGVDQTKGTLAAGRMILGQVTRVVFGQTVVEDTAARPGRPGLDATSEPIAEPAPVPAKPRLRTPAAPTRPPAGEAPARKAPAKKAPAKKAPAKKAAKQATATKAARKAPEARATAGDTPTVTPADIADQVAKRPPAERTTPLTARQVADVDDAPEVATPVGTTAADVATNPDTTDHDLQQPGTEPLLDPSTAKAVRSEQETLRRAADLDKG